MSSQIKIEAKVVPKVVSGKTFLKKLGEVTFEWTIEDFKQFLELGQAIKSPRFEIETTDPSMNVRSFHLEMEMPNKGPHSECLAFPVFLVNETGGDYLMKMFLFGSSPKFTGVSQPHVSVKLNASVVGQPSPGPRCMDWNTRLEVMTVTVAPSNPPKEVVIATKFALVNVSEKNVL
jgi:hypothetical protein